MDRKILFFIIAEALVCQVFTANLNLHPALLQHLLTSIGSSPAPLTSRQSLPAVTVSKQTSSPNFQSLAALASLLSSGHAPALPPKPQQSVSIPTSTSNFLSGLSETPSSSNGGVDASLLNNLAMALQLLIVSNLLSSPPQESTPEPVVVPGYPLYESPETVQPISVSYAPYPQQKPVAATPMPPKQSQNQYYQYEQPPQPQNYSPQPQQMSMPNSNFGSSMPNANFPNANFGASMPNANFVGSSNFADNPFMGSVPPPSGASSSRSGFTLMSPYEALSPSSPFSDPILSSPYGSIMTSKKDFQSPYTSIMASDNKELFSMSDFF